MKKMNINELLSRFDDHWNPRVIGELNGQHVKAAKLLGEFDWHQHDDEDELFWVISGELEIHWKEESGDTKCVSLSPGEFVIVPRGVQHRPVAKNEVQVVLFEPASTVNTGNVVSERTRVHLERLA
jgi:mannose-6-phosphate isomerase-like protein (cupin superfamily)